MNDKSKIDSSSVSFVYEGKVYYRVPKPFGYWLNIDQYKGITPKYYRAWLKACDDTMPDDIFFIFLYPMLTVIRQEWPENVKNQVKLRCSKKEIEKIDDTTLNKKVENIYIGC